MPLTSHSLEQIFQAQIHTLALTLRPDTVSGYRGVTRRFLTYLRAAFPRVLRLNQLRRDPHLLGWFRSLCEQKPPLSNKTRINLLLCLRRLPILAVPNASPSADLVGIRQALAAARHLLEMYRRQVGDEKTRRTLQRLDRRLLAVVSHLNRLAKAEK